MTFKGAVRAPQTIDGATLTLVPTPGRRKAQLNTLEDRAAAASGDERDQEFGELLRQRTAELLSRPEVMALGPMTEPDPEFIAWWEAIQAAARLEMEKR